MLLRVALSVLAVSLFSAGPASAQFATSDLTGTWAIHALAVPPGPSATPTWATGTVQFNASGMAIPTTLGFADFFGDEVVLTPGSLSVSPSGDVTGTLGDLSFNAQFAPGQGVSQKSQIVGVVRSEVGTPDETAAFFIMTRVEGVLIGQSDLTGTWRVKSLQVPGPLATVSEHVFGRIVVSSEGEITGGSLTSSNGSTSTFVRGNVVFVTSDGAVNGILVTSPFGNESSFFVSNFTIDKDLMVGVLIRNLDADETRLGMFVLQREPTVQYVTTDLGGQWELFGVQSREDPGTDGFTLSGPLTLDTFGNVTGGTLVTSTGETLTAPDGFFLLDNNGLISGVVITTAGTVIVQATMLPAKNQIFGVDRLVGTVDGDPVRAPSVEGQYVGLFTMVKAGAAAPTSTVQFRAGNVTVPEGTAATFFVDRSGATTTAVTVTYTATPVNAVPGQDYTPVGGILSFPAGTTSRSFTVPTQANTRLDGNRSVLLTLGAPTNGAMLGRDTSVLTILDNDQPGTVRLSAATYTVLESVANLVVTVMRAGTNLAGNVSVMLSTEEGTAESGEDYRGVETLVTFDANQTVKTVSIPIINDTLAEGNETFVVRLSDPSPGLTLGTPATATATITDNDVAGTLKFEKAAYSVTEEGGSVVLKVLRSGGLASGVTVRVTTMDGSACGECGDYGEQDGTLSFGAGNTSATITIPIGQDLRAEGNETFTVVLSDPQGGAGLVAPSVATVTIVDDESAFQLSAGAYAIKEGLVNAVVTVERSGALVTPASVTFTATPGTAVAGLDFTPVSTVVAFPVSTRTKTVNVPIRNNTLVQGNRTVMLELSGPTGGAQLGTRATGVLTITEDDQPGVIRLSAATSSVGERAGSLLVTLLRAGTTLAGNVSVSFATGNGSATAGLDYTATAGTVTFAANETMKTVRIPILDDALVEGNETIPFTIFDPTSGATLTTPATAVITIVDDDKGGLVKFSAATYSFTEGAGNASITVVRSGGTASDVLVDYTFQDVTATGGDDYGAANGTLSFGANQLTATIPVPIVQDLLAEGNETFRITLGNVRGGAALVVPVVATVTIVDDESAIQFQRPDFTGREGTPAVITVVRSGALTTPATVTFTAQPGTAAAGLDFTPVSTVLTFPANTPTKTVNVPLLNNPLVQGNRTVLLALGAPTGGAQLGPNATAVLTALDDDQGGIVRLSTAAYVVNEASPSLLVDILRTGTNLAGNVSVDFATVDGTARANVSYVARIGTVVFNAGETKKTVIVPLINDTVVRGPLSFSFVLSRPTGGASLGTPSSATIAVADNDLGGTVRLSGSAFQTIEGNGNFSVMVVRSGGAASEAAVDYTISHVSTDAGDVAATTGTVTFAANQTTAAIPIPILQDAISESNETFTVSLGNARGGAVLGAPFSATVTIVDDEVMIQFTGRFQGNQPEVSRTGPLGGSTSVQFTTSSGTAILGQDFTLAESGTLVFPASKAIVLLPLTIIADNLAEGPETFTVTLRNPAAPAQLGPNFTQMFTIQDNNFGGRVQFGAAQYAGQEGQAVTLTVRREGGAGTVLPVTWSLIGGNASASDFSPSGGVLTFGPTETSKTLVITLTADALVEGPETATLALSVAPGAGELGPNGVTQLRIGDATVAPSSVVQLASATASAVEGDTVSIVVTRTGDLSQAASIEYVTSPGTATLGDDYALVGGSITFGPGSSSATIMAGTNVDQITEGPETFSITLQNPSGNAAIGTPSTVVVTITDPEPVGYTFRLVAEAGAAPIRALGGLPAVNNAGLVAFRSTIVDDSLPAIMTATAGGPPTILTTSADEDFDSFGDPVIADSGMVAFRAFLNGGGAAVYRAAGDGGSLDPVARPDAAYSGFGDPSVSRGGRISFRASLFDGEEESIVAGILGGGGLFTVTTDADGVFAGYGQTTATGDLDSHVAFVASESSGASGVYLSTVDGDAGIITQIVDGSEFDALNQYVSINNQGQVAFLGFPVGGGSGIFVSRNGSALTTIATTGAVFDSFGAEDGDGTPSINDAGAVAFYATLTDGGGGIFTGPDPVADKVIALGDPLLDSTVVQIFFGGMNNAGQIVFLADLDDERRVIVLATPGGGLTPGGADIAVSIGASPSNPGVGSVVTLTVTATNLGPAVAAGVQVGSLLPAGFALQSATPSQGTYSSSPGAWNVGTLLNGASATLTLQAQVQPAGPYTVTATRTASTPADGNAGNDTATVTVTPAALVVTTEGPLVGVARTISGQVSLGSPAPAGGVSVTLGAAPGGLVTLAPSSVSIPAGATTGNFSITGVAIGGATITASAPGFQDGTAPIAVTGSVISLGALPTLGLGQSASLPISLSTAAPAGGVTVTFGSNNPAVATVTPSVFIPGGAQVPAANPQVTGVNVGSTQINATATGFAPDSRGANVSVSVTFSPTTFGVVVGTSGNITVNISAAAPAGGLTLTLTTGNTSVATVVSSVTVPQGQLSVPAAVTGVAIASTTLQASGSGVTSSTATINVTAPPAITVSAETIGRNLQVQGSLSLGAPAPAGGVPVTLTSGDGSKVLLSTTSTGVGTGQIVVVVNAGASGSSAFWVQAITGTGNTSVVASAPGYTNGSALVTLTPGGFRISSPGSFSTTTLSANQSIQLIASRLNPGTLTVAANQQVRGGLAPIAVTVTATDQTGGPGVGTLASPVTFNAGDLVATTAFDPVSAGTSLIEVQTPVGFDTSATGRSITATVNAPALGVSAETVGKDLQVPALLTLDAPAPPGGLLVTLTSSDAARVLLSTSNTGNGSAQITLPVGAGAGAATFWVQGLVASGTASVLATAPGFTNASATTTLTPSGFRIGSPGSFTTTTLAANQTIQLVASRLNPGTLTIAANQQVRAGITPVAVTVTATDQTGGPGVGTLTTGLVTFAGGDVVASTAFDPVNAGTSLIAFVTPAGFDTAASGQSITVTVNAPTLSLFPQTVGLNLQTPTSFSLDAAAPAGGLPVTLTSSDPSRVLLSASGTTAGSGQIVITVPAGNTGASFWIQGLAASGGASVTATAPGFGNDSATITLTPAGFRLTSGSFTTTTFSADTPLQVIASRLDPATLTVAENQQLRAGIAPVSVAVTATDQTGGPGVGSITTSPLTFAGGSLIASTAFNPAATGTSLIEVVTPAGFNTSAVGRVITATVSAPSISVGFTTLPVGKDLQDAVFISLGATPPSPVTVTVRVTSAAVATLATSATAAGTDTVTFTNVTTTSVGTLFIQGRAIGSTTVTVQAPGYADDTGTVTVQPSGFIIVSGNITTTTAAANTNVQVNAGRLDPTTLNFSVTQQVRGGATINVPVTAADQTGGPGVGTITTSPLVFSGGQSVAITQFNPAVTGTSVITVGTPTGFSTPSNNRQITATVNP